MNPISSSPPTSSIYLSSAPTNTANCATAIEPAPLELKKITINQSHRIGKIDEGCNIFSLSANGKRMAATSASSREIFIYEIQLDGKKLEKIRSFDRKTIPLDPYGDNHRRMVNSFQGLMPPFVQKGISFVSKVPVIADFLEDFSKFTPISDADFFNLLLSANGKLLFVRSMNIAWAWSCDIASEPRVIWRPLPFIEDVTLTPIPVRISSDMKWVIEHDIPGKQLLLSRFNSLEEDIVSRVQSNLPAVVGGKAKHILGSNKKTSNDADTASSLPITIIFPDNNKWVASVREEGICFTKIYKVDKVTSEIEEKVWNFSEKLPITAVAHSRDGKWLAFGRIDGGTNIITLINKNDQSDEDSTLKGPCLRLEEGTSKIIQMAFTKDSKWLASVSEDNIIRVWSMQTYEAKATVEFEVPASISEITWQKTDAKISLIIIAKPEESIEPKVFEIYVIDIGTRPVTNYTLA